MSKEPEKSEDPFDPESLKIKSNFTDQIGVKKVITKIPVCKPDRQCFFRVHSDPTYRLETALVDFKEEREIYLVEQSLCAELPTEVVPKVLYYAITRQNNPFLWHIRLPNSDGKLDAWNQSALDAAELAQKKWVRCSANMGAGHYDVFEATGNLSEPEWPDLSFKEILKLAFKGRYINSLDHPVIQKLQGLV